MTNSFVTRWINDLTNSINRCVKRFPAAVFFIVALTFWVIYLNHTHVDNMGAITYYFAVGIPLSIMLQLWCEEIKTAHKRIITQVTGHALLLADAIFLYMVEHCSPGRTTAHFAIVLSIVIAAFLIPFYRERNDVSCWNFVWRSIVAFIKAAITGLLFTGGVELLIFSISALFGLEFSNNIYLDIFIIFTIGLTWLFFIGTIPAGEHKHDPSPRANTFLNIMVRYVFIPLVACYIIVLYVYAARIIVMWQLPDGYVSWLVTVLMVGCILIEMGLYPIRQFPEKKKTDEAIARYLPLLILPLLVLMTIGIIRRINDYGITYMRLYLIAFNVWCYGVCIVLFITRARRIGWIPASFAAVFLLTSIIPKFNFTNIALENIQGSLAKTMKLTCTDTPPLSEEQYANWINSLPEKEGQLINDKFIYLADNYNNSKFNRLVADSINFYDYRLYYSDDTNYTYHHFNVRPEDKAIAIPHGATHMAKIALYDYEELPTGPTEQQLHVGLNDTDSVYIDLATINKLDSADAPYYKLRQNHNDFKFVLMGLSTTVSDSIVINHIDGYLFKLNNTER